MFKRDIEEELVKWSTDYDRKPLLLRGARQVGKTTVVRAFGKSFQQYIELNLENERDSEMFGSRDIETIVQTIFLSNNKNLAFKENTLLFIDEIQQVPEAVNMLRYFYEKYPEIKVIAAGSLLETIFNEEKSIPVGRVDYRVMRPVSFPEFLGALGEEQAQEQLKNIPLNDFAHTTLIRLFHTYAVTGGMPEIVNRYA
ncbi:MAG: AAA family ATPase, partial [Chitinophagaceae bacterium]|nr:AAA family ATPase [Chitinophagaceae bacterium]